MSDERSEFEKAADNESGSNVVTEFVRFLAHNKKWWLAPIVIVMLLIGILVLLAGTPAAPFIYTLF